MTATGGSRLSASVSTPSLRLSFYLAQTATASTYGAAGSLAVLLLWVNYSALILLFGAAITRADVEGRGQQVQPRNTAVRMRRELVESPPDPAADDGHADSHRPA